MSGVAALLAVAPRIKVPGPVTAAYPELVPAANCKVPVQIVALPDAMARVELDERVVEPIVFVVPASSTLVPKTWESAKVKTATRLERCRLRSDTKVDSGAVARDCFIASS